MAYLIKTKIVIIFYKQNEDCSFRRLAKKALHIEKTTIKKIDLPTIWNCENTCTYEKSCKSVTYCHDGANKNKCYLSSLELNEGYPQDSFDDDCKSSFDPCVKGKTNHLHILSFNLLRITKLITVTLFHKYHMNFR